MGLYQERRYREWVRHGELIVVRVVDEETDLLVSGTVDLSAPAARSVSKYRRQLKEYIAKDRNFLLALEPMEVSDSAPQIVKDMAESAKIAGVGPMAAVAGAIAEYVAKDLLPISEQVIIENGGDIFIKTSSERVVGIYAGGSPFTGKIGILIKPNQTPLGVCTSSGTVGHSLSFGKSDAVTILSKSSALADAVATATGNLVKTENDVQTAVEFARSIQGVEGVLIIIGSKIGIWGNVEVVRI